MYAIRSYYAGVLGIEYSDTVYRDAYLADTDLVLVANFQSALITGAIYETSYNFV